MVMIEDVNRDVRVCRLLGSIAKLAFNVLKLTQYALMPVEDVEGTMLIGIGSV